MDLYRGELSLRRAWSYVIGLPPDCALRRSLDPDHRWTHQAMLTAQLIDEVRFIQYMYAKASGVRGVKEPDPIERPGIKARTEAIGASEGFATVEELHEFFDGDPWLALVAGTPN